MIAFDEQATEELEAVVHWYNEVSVDTAVRFLSALDRAVQRVQTDPESWAEVGDECRYISLMGFPYILIFHFDAPDTITIVAVSHTSRRPGYWRSRLR